MAISAKERAKEKLLKYLADPNNDFLTRDELSTQVLGYKQPNQIHKLFSGPELHEIEAEALEIRRTKYAPFMSRVDKNLLKKASGDDATAADMKLAYQRFEKWKEPKEPTKLIGDEKKPISVKHDVSPELRELMNEVMGIADQTTDT